MARVRYDEVDQYTTSTTNFFQLKEDRDVATVRILYNNVNKNNHYDSVVMVINSLIRFHTNTL